MRVAVLSLIESAGDEPDVLRGYLPIGGRSILRHQIGLALSLGCKRIVVMAEAISGELVAMQHAAERGGAQFHVIATARMLAPLLLPDDDVFVLGDGLLVMPDAAREMLDAGPVVLTLPVETALPLGFERIDINYAFAAAMRFPGRVAAGLAELPPEWNVQSALLRLAAQARIAHRGVPASLLNDGRWNIVRTEAEAHRVERQWLNLHTTKSSAGSATPGERLTTLIVRRLGPAMLHAGTRPALAGVAAGAVGLLGGGLGWLGHFAIGFLLLGLGWMVERVASLLGQIERNSLLVSGSARRGVAIFHLLIDAGFVTLATWRCELPPGHGWPWGAAAFAPVLLIGMMRLVPLALANRPWSRWLEDRLLTGCVLAIVSIFLPFDAAVALAVLGLLGTCLFALQFEGSSPNPRLTSEA
ncbi:hypothetical protein OVA07_11560 [Novosphingobium sp. SL115]|uniref:hypothetical protein n=1 Tax=Novosphingobium sp. SL115 TaxID=2995150 RepID=UPI0022754767|nr:hypothetical protein [Novosphingobium sp. SL115]MCY1671644.1 hypothetical protein [Novosphingobium sp. SL115]